jgi:hypothetical protein
MMSTHGAVLQVGDMHACAAEQQHQGSALSGLLNDTNVACARHAVDMSTMPGLLQRVSPVFAKMAHLSTV